MGILGWGPSRMSQWNPIDSSAHCYSRVQYSFWVQPAGGATTHGKVRFSRRKNAGIVDSIHETRSRETRLRLPPLMGKLNVFWEEKSEMGYLAGELAASRR